MIDDLLTWLADLPQPALVAVTGLLVLAECTVGVGIVVPGESALLVSSTTATTAARFVTLWWVVAVCAAAGDCVGYAVGRRYGPRIRDSGVVRRHGAGQWDRAATLLRRRGATAVLVARFLPVMRTMTPTAAGAAGLPLRVFLPAVVIGATSWSLLHVAIGASLGQAAARVEQVLGGAGVVVLVVLLLIGVVVMRRFSIEDPGGRMIR